MNQLPSSTILKSPSCEYRIISVLGAGAFAITYLAEAISEVNGHRQARQVVIKQFADNGNGNKEQAQMMAEKIRQVSHANIVDIADIFERDQDVFCVIDYIRGGTLDGYIAGRGRLTEQQALAAIKEIGSAWLQLNRQGIKDLTVTTKDIFRRPDGRLILADFPTDSGGEGTDVYALGAILYEALTGQRVPRLSEIASRGLPTATLLRCLVSEPVIAVVKKAMQPAKADSYPSVDDMLQAISAISVPKSIRTFDDPGRQPCVYGSPLVHYRGIPLPPTPLKRWLTYGIIVIAVAAAIITLLAFL